MERLSETTLSGILTVGQQTICQVVGTVKFGDMSEVAIEGSSTVLFEAKTGEHLPLMGVYDILRLVTNIISLDQLDEGNYDVRARHDVLHIRNNNECLIVRVQRSVNRMYLLRVMVGRALCLAARLWHERYDHLHFNALSKLERRRMAKGLPYVDHIHQLCVDGVTTKLKRSPFPSQAKWRAAGMLDLVHGDLCGPITPSTPGGKRYFLLLVDDKSRYMWLVLLAVKSDILTTLKKLHAKVEVETGRRLRLRIDNGGEFTSVEFESYYVEHEIDRQHTTLYTPQRNGVVERRNQTMVMMAHILLKSRSLPMMFWG
jgi:transposase InsO family protein